MWLPLALLAAFFSALVEIVQKRLVRKLEATVVAFVVSVTAVALLLPIVLWQGMRVPTPGFWLAVVVSGGINVVAAVLIPRSFQLSDLSLVSPLKGTTPVFTLIVAAFVLGERPSWLGAAGVGLVVVGTYLLSSAGAPRGWTAPLRALWANRGARMMLLVAFLYGTSSTFDKVGVLASTPLQWALALQLAIAAGTGARVLRAPARRAALREVDVRAWLLGLAAGAATAAMMIAQMTALTVGLAGYVIAVKRVGILLAVLAGGLLFRERHLRARLLAAATILAGLGLLAAG